MPKDNPVTTMDKDVPETVITEEDFRFAGAEEVGVAVTV